MRGESPKSYLRVTRGQSDPLRPEDGMSEILTNFRQIGEEFFLQNAIEVFLCFFISKTMNKIFKKNLYVYLNYVII